MKYMCESCGFIYDPEEGDPDGGIPPGTEFEDIPDLARAFRIFGRPQRTAVCDCERPKAPALAQTLFVMTDAALLAKLKGGLVRTLTESDQCDAELVEELFLATLSRPPSWDEARAALDHLRTSPGRASGLADVLWALINTSEFVLNH